LHEAGLNWIATRIENDWDICGRLLCRTGRSIAAGRHQHSYAVLDKLSGKRGQVTIVTQKQIVGLSALTQSGF
jgi:hypothetical protein